MAFKGSVAIVTGGASGMGRMSCERLAAAGARVFAMDMDEAGLASLAEQHDSVTTLQVDVSSFDQVSDAVARAQRDLGDIDRLTHCAAIMPLALLDDMPIETITKQMRINYDGTVYLVKSVLPGMLERDRGDIISFGSIAGPNFAKHQASKKKRAPRPITEARMNGNKANCRTPAAIVNILYGMGENPATNTAQKPHS